VQPPVILNILEESLRYRLPDKSPYSCEAFTPNRFLDLCWDSGGTLL
jgi:hypothetical protein